MKNRYLLLGWLDIILGVCMFVYYLYWIVQSDPSSRLESAMSWYLPFIISAMLSLSGGLLTLKRKELVWSVVGITFIVAALAYYFGLMWLFRRWA